MKYTLIINSNQNGEDVNEHNPLGNIGSYDNTCANKFNEIYSFVVVFIFTFDFVFMWIVALLNGRAKILFTILQPENWHIFYSF